MILSDRDIRAAMQRLENPLIIDPGFDPGRLQPASLELTLGTNILVGNKGLRDQPDWLDIYLPDHSPFQHEPGAYPLSPGEFILGTTAETVHIPTDMAVQVNGKSSLGRQGLLIHATAGFADPGFRGQLTLEMYNLTDDFIFLRVGMVICQLVFFQLTSPAERPYGHPQLGSHYQGQRGPTPSRG